MLDDVLEHLRGLGLRADWHNAPSHTDGYLTGTLTLDDGTTAHAFPAVASTTLSTASIALLPHDSRSILLTRHVATPRADALTRHGWGGYTDAAGNVSLRAPGLVLEVTGRRSPGRVRTPTTAPFTRAGLPVTFALLVAHGHGEQQMVQRELAVAGGASVGTVNRVIRALRDRTPPMLDEHNRLLRPEALQDEWVAAYATAQPETWPEERFTSGTWSSPLDLLRTKLPPGTLLGSELGAVRLGASLRPVGALLHVPPEERGDIIRRGRLRRAEDGPIRLRPAFWTAPPIGSQGIAPRPLLAADLLLEDDPRLDEIRVDLCGGAR